MNTTDLMYISCSMLMEIYKTAYAHQFQPHIIYKNLGKFKYYLEIVKTLTIKRTHTKLDKTRTYTIVFFTLNVKSTIYIKL